MKFLLLNGSPNEKGNTHFLLNKIGQVLEKEEFRWKVVQIHNILLSARTPFCNCCSQPCNQSCYKGTALERLYQEMVEADCLIFGSPVYFGNMTGQLKTLFDKSRRQRMTQAFLGKPAGVVTVGASRYGGQETAAGSIIDSLQVQGMTVFNDGFFGTDAGHKGLLAQRPASEDASLDPLIKNFAKRAILEAEKYHAFQRRIK